jgi:TRAP-type C4-dicarboxylate transport system substrate-binding protein
MNTVFARLRHSAFTFFPALAVVKFGTLLLTVLALLVGAQAQAAVFKVATLAPNGGSWMKTMRAAGKEIEQSTDGRVKFKFYPGGVMGSDDAVMRKIRFGQLQGGAVSGGALSAAYADIQVYALPLKFKTFDEVDFVRERMDQDIIAGIEKGGFVTFGFAGGGFAYVLSQAPISSTQDLKSHKVWIPNNDKGALVAVQAFGVSPIPLNLSDVLAGLQTGLVDTVATSPIGAIALHWHTQVKYMTDVPIMYLFATLALDKKAFYKLAPEDQVIVRDKMEAAFTAIEKQNRADNIAAYNALLTQGIELVALSDDERAQWFRLAEQGQQDMVSTGVVSEATVKILDQHLEAYRATAGQQ